MNSKLFVALALAVSLAAKATPPATMASRGIGAGGGMYCPVISPHSAQTIFLGCDMSELFYTHDGAGSWQTVDFRQLQAATLTEVQYTSDPQIMYALDWTNTAPSGNTLERPGLSTDGGAHWTPCPGWQSGRVCYSVYAAWNSTTRVFAADASKLWMSSNSGATFTVAVDFSTLPGYTGSTNARLAGAFFDGSEVWIASNLGILYSSDGGDSFNVFTPSGFNTTTESIVSFCGAKDPSSNAIRFYCVTARSTAAAAGAIVSSFYFQNPQIYRLDGSGTSWAATTAFSSSARNGIALNDFPGPIAMARNNIDVVYTAVNRTNGSYPNNNSVYKLTSAGGAWSSVFFIPGNQNIITGWGGAPSNGRLDYAFPLGLCVDPNDSNRVITCDDALIHMTTSGGTLWSQLYVNPADQNAANTPIPSSTGYRGIGLEPTAAHWIDWSTATTMCVGCSDMSMIRATDDGTRWFFPGGFLQDEIYQIIHHPASGVMYAVNNNLPSPYFVFGLNDATYDAASGSVYFSSNGGATWSVLKSSSAMGNAAPVWITLDVVNDRLYVSTANSSAGGIWRIDSVSLGAGAAVPVKLTAPPRTQGHAYCLRVLSHGELVCTYSGRYLGGVPPNQGWSQSSGVFYSTDGGATWSDRSDMGVSYGMTYYTQEVAIDPYDANENTWYACVWNTTGFTNVPNGQPSPNTLGGLYKTTDRGLTWTRIYSADRAQSVTINPNAAHSDEMYLCTRFSGLVYTNNLHDPLAPTFTPVASFPFRQPTHVFYHPYNQGELWVTSYGNGLLTGAIPAGAAQFNPAVFTVTEGGVATITVSRVGGDTGPLTVNYSTADGTASSGADYVGASGTLVWADGETADKTFTVSTKIDQLVEGSETVNLQLNGDATGTLTVNDSPMDNWRAARFGANANITAIGGDNADPDHDGLPNLLEYALGTDPNAANACPLTATIEDGCLTLTLPHAALPGDVILSAEVSSSPDGPWTPAAIVSNTSTLFKAQDTVLATSVTSRFIRMVVTRQ